MIDKANNDVKKTVKSMIIGSMIYNLFVLAGAIIFSIIYKKDILFLFKNIFVVIIGCIVCILGIYSLYKSVTYAVDIASEKQAKNHMIFNSICRIIVFMIVLVAIMIFFGTTSMIIYAISVLGIKIGAYLAPMIKNKI